LRGALNPKLANTAASHNIKNDEEGCRDRTARILDDPPTHLHEPLELGDTGGCEPTLHRILWLQAADIELDAGKHVSQSWTSDRAGNEGRRVLAMVIGRDFLGFLPRIGDDRSRVVTQHPARHLGLGAPLTK
jgi:hypothetical protein